MKKGTPKRKMPGWWNYFYLGFIVFALTFSCSWLMMENIRVDEYIELAVYFDGMARNSSAVDCEMREAILPVHYCDKYELMRFEILPDTVGKEKAERYDRICGEIKNRTLLIFGDRLFGEGNWTRIGKEDLGSYM